MHFPHQKGGHLGKYFFFFFTLYTIGKLFFPNATIGINSLKKQTFKNFEYLIIDGKSTDRTIKNILINRRYINLLISEKDAGIYYAMNKALKFINGEVVVFINAGDVFVKNGLLTIYKKFQKNPVSPTIIVLVGRSQFTIPIIT